MPHQFIPFKRGSNERDNDLAQSAEDAPIRLITDGEYRLERGLSKRNGFTKLVTEFLSTERTPGTIVSNGRSYGVLRPWDFLPGSSAGVLPADENYVSFANHFRTERALEVTDGRSLTTPSVAVGTPTGGALLACVVANRANASPTTEVLVTITEPSTGTVRYREVITGHRHPAVVWVGDRFQVFAYDTADGTIDTYIYTPAAGASGAITRTTATAYGSATTAGSIFDVCADGTTSLLACRDNATNNLIVRRFNAAGTQTQSISQAVTGTAPQQVQVLTDDAGAVHVVHCPSSGASPNTAYLETFTATLSARSAGSTAIFTTITDQYAVYAANLAGSSQLALVSHAFDSVTTGTGHTVRHALIDTDHTDLTSVVTLNSGHVLSKPMTVRYGSSVARPLIAVKVANGDDPVNLFPTAILAEIPRGGSYLLDGLIRSAPSGFEWSATLWNDAEATLLGGRSAWAVDSTTGDQYVALTNAVSYNSNGLTTVSVEQSSVVVVRVTTALSGAAGTRTSLPKVAFGDTAYVGGGLLRFFDGVNFGEVVPMPPAHMTLAQGSGSNLAAGDYSYCAILCWEDAVGNLHRSAPCQVATRAHAGTNGIVATLRAHWATMLDTDVGGQQWAAELYRTTDEGSTFYFVSSKAVTPNASLAFAEDSLSDAILETRRTLYTTGGFLQNEPPPAPAALCVHQGRLWGISGQDPRVLFCSKLAEERVAPEFNPSLQVRLDEPAVALASVDDKLVAFSAGSAWYVGGEGPDNLGNGSFNPPERVEGSAGASSAKAVVTFPGGALVHGAAGFQLLGRDLSFADVDYLPVTFPRTYRIGATVHLADKRQIWFARENVAGASIGWVMYDYGSEQLRVSVFQLRSASLSRVVDFQSVGGAAYVLAQTGSGVGDLFVQSTTSFADDGTFIPWSVTLGWWVPDGVTGECRFRKFTVHGRTPAGAGECALEAAVYVQRPRDQNSAAVSTFNWASLEAPGAPLFYRRGTIARQRGLAVRADLALSSTGGATVEGPTLHGVGWDTEPLGQQGRQGGAKAPS